VIRLKNALEKCALETTEALEKYVPESKDVDSLVYEAMRYSLLAGGKRLRPFLVFLSSDIFEVPRYQALACAVAIEMVHTYSLIHDDLPSMDNDDLRRGRPTCHKEFDEATAILAGDALLTMAFQIVSSKESHPDGEIRSAITQELAIAAGAAGMVGGQAMDLAAETSERSFDLDTIVRLQSRKTGALIRFSCEAGAILAGDNGIKRTALRCYADDIGLAFQIADDLLDYEGDESTLGKAAGKDIAAGKATFVGLLGPEIAREKAENLVSSAIARLDIFDHKAELLREVARYIIERKN
tara:strand:- start:18220 stop:19113 length:894 start_codon:yes stop_codon:yes gene_type:complete